jgi:P27 family predicted phage terminase small subunit
MSHRKPLDEIAGHRTKEEIAKREHQIMPAPITPQMPVWIDPEAKFVWERTVRTLEETGTSAGPLCELDGDLITLYAVAVTHWVQLEKELAGMPLTFTGARGKVRPNPLVSSTIKASNLASDFFKKLGLDPASRIRSIGPRSTDGEDEAFFFGK